MKPQTVIGAIIGTMPGAIKSLRTKYKADLIVGGVPADRVDDLAERMLADHFHETFAQFEADHGEHMAKRYRAQAAKLIRGVYEYE
ncbi:hypothetical protein [Ruegeria arenilitoris]|uniref:hypothetical protein n=1 Tax=Ruegeria arenilitoris TaxID=1173585 RepID=UPI00147AE281|nr:hypothetical protein [Ruegeria arenilitoris]